MSKKPSDLLSEVREFAGDEMADDMLNEMVEDSPITRETVLLEPRNDPAYVLRSEFDIACSERDRLSQQVSGLIRRNSDLNLEVAQLQTNNQMLAEANDELKKKYWELREKSQ